MSSKWIIILNSTRMLLSKDGSGIFSLMNYKPVHDQLHVPYFCFLTFQFLWLFTVVHRSLFSTKQHSAGKQQGSSTTQQQQRAVARQRLEHAELCGFKPIDSPASAVASTASKRQASGKDGHKTSSESSNNPLSGDEFY